MRATPWTQGRLFETPERIARPPGWNLIANSVGSHGFHVVDRTTPEGGVVTVCGIVGHVISTTAPEITPCPICAETEPS